MRERSPEDLLRWPRPFVRPAAVLLLAAAAAACAGPGLESRYRESSRRWEDGAPPALAAEPGPDPFAGQAVLERDELVAEVLRRNPSIQAARYAWRAALARYPQETAFDDPKLGYGVAPLSFGSDTVDPAQNVDLSQKIPFPGKLALRGEAALAEAEAAEQDLEAVRLRLATMAWLLFDQYYLVERSIGVNAHHLALLGEFRRLAATRYESGQASQQDPLQAEVEQARLMQTRVSLTAARRVATDQLDVLLHRPPGTPLPPPPAVLDTADAGLPDPDDALARALAERPELRAADARIRSGEAMVSLARREYFPDVTVLGAYQGLMQERDLRPFVGISLDVPLQLGRRQARLDEARARLEGARRERAGVEDEVRFDVESTLARLDEARQVLELSRDRLLPAASDQLQAARIGFVSGRNSFLALIEAENNLRDVELGLERARVDVSRRVAELRRATGTLPAEE